MVAVVSCCVWDTGAILVLAPLQVASALPYDLHSPSELVLVGNNEVHSLQNLWVWAVDGQVGVRGGLP